MSLPHEEETPAETIERLERLNNHLAQMVKRGSDRLAESARELLAQGWDAGFTAGCEDHQEVYYSSGPGRPNPYRQPIELPGD